MKRHILLGLVLLTAQALVPEVEITAEPHHHLAFENKSVRVFNVDVPPHSDTLMHWHRHDYIYVTLGDAQVVNAVKDKPPATVKLRDGETRFSPAPFAHIARNPTDQPFRNVTIEILEDEALRNSAAKWEEDRGLDVLTNGTKQILFVKDAIRVSEIELKPGAVVPMQHQAGPYLLVAVTDLNLRDDNVRNDEKTLVPGAFTLDLASGGQTWLPSKSLHSLTNVGKNPAKFVTLEFP